MPALNQAPAVGTLVFVANPLLINGTKSRPWSGRLSELYWLSRGLIFDNEIEAREHSRVMLAGSEIIGHIAAHVGPGGG